MRNNFHDLLSQSLQTWEALPKQKLQPNQGSAQPPNKASQPHKAGWHATACLRMSLQTPGNPTSLTRTTSQTSSTSLASPAGCRGQAGLAGAKKKGPPAACAVGGPEGGGYLLSRFRSTIGAAGFNFSVRDGKRWGPRAMAALISLKRSDIGSNYGLV